MVKQFRLVSRNDIFSAYVEQVQDVAAQVSEQPPSPSDVHFHNVTQFRKATIRTQDIWAVAAKPFHEIVDRSLDESLQPRTRRLVRLTETLAHHDFWIAIRHCEFLTANVVPS